MKKNSFFCDILHFLRSLIIVLKIYFLPITLSLAPLFSLFNIRSIYPTHDEFFLVFDSWYNNFRS